MKITRNVIVDLLPLYVAGEAHPDTRALVDEYLKGDGDMAAGLLANDLESLHSASPMITGPKQDLELKALRRARSLLGWQRRLYAWALALSILPLSSVFWAEQGHVKFQFLLGHHPAALIGCASLAATCWINYFMIRRRLRRANP